MKMKKILSLFLSVLMIFSITSFTMSAFAADVNSVAYATNASVNQSSDEQTVSVDFGLTSNPGYASLNYTVKFDETYITMKSVSLGTLITGNSAIVNQSNLKQVGNNFTANWSDDYATENITETGVAYVFEFVVAKNAPVGDYEISFELNTAYDCNIKSVKDKFSNAKAVIKVTSSVSYHEVKFVGLDGNAVGNTVMVADGTKIEDKNIPAVPTAATEGKIVSRAKEGYTKATGKWVPTESGKPKIDENITSDVTFKPGTELVEWPVISARFGAGFMDNGEKTMKSDMSGWNNEFHTTGSKGTTNKDVTFKGYIANELIPGKNPFAGKEYYPVSAYTQDSETKKYTLKDDATKNTAADLYDAVNNSYSSDGSTIEGYGCIPKNLSVYDSASYVTNFRYYDNVAVKYYLASDTPYDAEKNVANPIFRVVGSTKIDGIEYTGGNKEVKNTNSVETNKWKWAVFNLEDVDFTETQGITPQFHFRGILYNLKTMYENGEKVYINNIVISPDKIDVYTVTFKGDTDYEVEVIDDEAAVFGGEITVPGGKKLAGWSLTEGGEAIVGDIKVTADTTLYPVIKDIETKVVYVSSAGNDTNDGLTKDTAKKTLASAMKLAKKEYNTVILITDDCSATSGGVSGVYSYDFGNVTITSKYGTEDYTATAKMALPNGNYSDGTAKGKVTFENVTIVYDDGNGWSFLNFKGVEPHFGENVKVEGKHNLKVRMGGENGDVDYDNFSGPIEFKSGNFGSIHLGSKSGAKTNNINFIYSSNGNKKTGINVGNDGGSTKGSLTGYSRVEINEEVAEVKMQDVENNADYAVIFNNGTNQNITPAYVKNEAKKAFVIYAGESFVLHNTDTVGKFAVEQTPAKTYLLLDGKVWEKADNLTLTESGIYKLTSADYKVEFKQGDNTLQTSYISAGDSVAFEGTTPTDGERYFSGWALSTAPENVVNLGTYTVSSDVVFVPVFTDKWIVKFVNGITDVATHKFVPGDGLTVVAPDAVASSEAHKIFSAWKNGDASYAAGATVPVTGSITYTAEFVDEQKYKASFYNSADDIGDETKALFVGEYYNNDSVTFPQGKQIAHFEFDGWYLSTDTEKTIITSYTMSTADVVFVAKYTEETKYTISIGNGTPQEHYAGDKIVLPSSISDDELNGGRFLGWTTVENGMVAEYAPGATYTVGTSAVSFFSVISTNKAWYYAKVKHVVYTGEYEVSVYVEGDKIQAASLGIKFDDSKLTLNSVTVGDGFLSSKNLDENNALGSYVSENGFEGDIYYTKNYTTTSPWTDAKAEGGVLVATYKFTATNPASIADISKYSDLFTIAGGDNNKFKDNTKYFYDGDSYAYVSADFNPENPLAITAVPLTLESVEIDKISKRITVSGQYEAADRATESAADATINTAVLYVYKATADIENDEPVETKNISMAANEKVATYSVELVPGAYKLVFKKTGYLTVCKDITLSDELADGATSEVDKLTALAGDIYDDDAKAKDEVVNIFDYIRVMRGFSASFKNSAENYAKYLREADLDEDGIITVEDLAVIKKNYGKTGFGYEE